MKAAIVALACLASCTPAHWRAAVRVTEIAAVSSLACDGGTTRQYLAESDWIETNPILGKHPSSGALWGYLGAIAAATIGANRILPAKVAVALNALVLGLEVQSVAINMGAGASPCGIGQGGPWEPMTSARR